MPVHFLLLLLCFFLSGLSGLVYQTAWTRQFAFVFGTSELAVATVLAGFMGGLALGAAAAARFALRVRRPLLAYGVLELGIALAALAVPYGIQGARALYVAAFGASEVPAGEGGIATALFYLASTLVILAVPTALMGATLPLLARHAVRAESEIGPRVGLLYAVNTLGAVAGTLLAAFALLPRIGLQGTIWAAVATNAGVFLAAAALASVAPAPPAASAPSARSALGSAGRWILPTMLVSGAVSFGYEVLWSRLLGHILGNSVYAFSTMLASFLLGIALGSAAASRLATTPARATRAFAWTQLGVAALSLGAFHLLDHLPSLARALGVQGETRLTTDVAVAMSILLPGALCIGATFPFAVRILARSREDAGPASARVFAWNTLGAILGAIAAGFFVIPWLGYEGALCLAVGLNLVLALATGSLAASGARLAGAAAALGLLALLGLRPGPPLVLLRTDPIRLVTLEGPITHYGVGRSATVLLVEHVDGWRLTTNGLPEAKVLLRGATTGAGGRRIPYWMGALPSLLRPEARSLCLVGLGGGLQVEAVPPQIERVDVIELETEVVTANRSIASQRRRDPLADPRVQLVVNDARNALLLSPRRYDAIVSQPSHPWTAGASHLYTREFFSLARERLAPGGVLVQWMGLAFVDEALLRTLLATLLDVFPHVQVYQPVPGGVLLAASDRPFDLAAGARAALRDAGPFFAELGVFAAEDLWTALLLDEREVRRFAADAPVSSDDRNLLQMHSPAIVRAGAPPPDVGKLFAAFDPLVRSDAELDRAYAVRRLLARRSRPRAARLARSIADPADRALALGLVDEEAGRRARAASRLEAAWEQHPMRTDLLFALARVRRSRLLRSDGELLELAARLPEPAASVLRGWRLRGDENWEGLRSLDAQLALARATGLEYSEALRLRIDWRLRSGEPRLAREALVLVDRLMEVEGAGGHLLTRAQAASTAGDTQVAATALREMAVVLARRRGSRQSVARAALDVLASPTLSEMPAAQRNLLEARFRQAAASPDPRGRSLLAP